MPLILRDPRDPPVQADGLCVVCAGERKPGQLREPHYSTAQADPFCSAECARAWYGVELPSYRYQKDIGKPVSECGVKA